MELDQGLDGIRKAAKIGHEQRTDMVDLLQKQTTDVVAQRAAIAVQEVIKSQGFLS